MDGAKRLVQWNATFVLMGEGVVCTGCMISQRVNDVEEAFPHGPNCKNNDGGARYPWVELHDILDTARG